MFFPTEYASRQAFLPHPAFDGRFNLVEHFLAMPARRMNCFFQHLVTQRIERGKTQVLQFHTQGINAQAIGDRRVDIQCFAGNTPAFIRAHHAERAHVV